jgi:hypothetical protein
MQWVQNPIDSNVENLNKVSVEACIHFRKKRRRILKLNVRILKLRVRQKILWTCIWASMILRRVTRLELI